MAFNLEEVDVDGAVREAADGLSGDTRLSFLKRGAVAGGAALSGGALLSALVPGAASAATAEVGAPPASVFGSGAAGILNYALTLEYLESSFYNEAAKHHVARGDRQLTAFLNTTQRDENYHVKLLQGALKKVGAKAIRKPEFNFGRYVSNKKDFAETAFALENTGVHAYLGQAPNLLSAPSYLIVAAEIVTVEARHSGAIGLYLGKPIAPSGPLDKPWTASQVLAAVEHTKFVKKLYPV